MTKPLRVCPNCAAKFVNPVKGTMGGPACPFCLKRLPETRQQPAPKPKTKAKAAGQCPHCAAHYNQPVGAHCPLCLKPLPETPTRKRVKRLMRRDGPNCWICGLPLTIDTATLDHITPRSKGGTNALRNLRLACSPCNNKRGNADVIGLTTPKR